MEKALNKAHFDATAEEKARRVQCIAAKLLDGDEEGKSLLSKATCTESEKGPQRFAEWARSLQQRIKEEEPVGQGQSQAGLNGSTSATDVVERTQTNAGPPSNPNTSANHSNGSVGSGSAGHVTSTAPAPASSTTPSSTVANSNGTASSQSAGVIRAEAGKSSTKAEPVTHSTPHTTQASRLNGVSEPNSSHSEYSNVTAALFLQI